MMKNTQLIQCTAHATPENVCAEKLRAYALLDMINDLCFTLDQSFRISYVNRFTCESFDKNASELVGKTLDEIFPYAKGLFDVDTEMEKLDQGGPLINEVQSPFSGSWFQITSIAFQDEYLIYMTNISTTKRYEKLLFEKDTLFLALASAVSDFIIIIDTVGRISHATPPASHFTGFQSDELEDHKIFEFVAAENHIPLQNHLDQLTKGAEKTSTFPILMKHQDGSLVQLHATAQNLQDQPGFDGILLKITR